VPFIR